MRKTLTLAAALLFAVSIHAADLTVDEILARNAAAKGGLEKLRAVTSMKLTGKMSFGPLEAPFVLVKKRPESMRVDFTLQNITATQAYDGTTGWTVMPFLGKKDPEAVSGDDLKAVQEQADFDGPFIDYAKKGNKIELIGKDVVEGTSAYKLALVTKDGMESLIYLNDRSFLEIKIEAKRKLQGQIVESETILSNYRDVNGLLFPFSMETRTKGASSGQVITIETIELNPPVDDASFKMPERKAAPEPARQ